jgi:dolichyl-phosphate beta-glucosyltransferase
MSKQIRPYLSLIIPAYNEAHRLRATVQEISRHRHCWPFKCEIIVVVEPSFDGTLGVAKSERSNIPELLIIANRVHRGKGFAVRTGMLAARGELVFFTDADLSTPLSDLDRAIALFQEQPAVDLIVGNRQHPESQILLRQSFVRELMGKTFNRLVQKLSGLRIADTQCGFKGFRSAAVQKIFQQQTTDGFAFDVEVLLLAQSFGLRIFEMPVHWSNSPESKVHVVRDSLRMLREILGLTRRVRSSISPDPSEAVGALRCRESGIGNCESPIVEENRP